MPRRFKERLAAGELVRIFSVARIVHPVVIDLVGLAGGYHGFWLDQEHGGLTYQEIQLASVCGRANGFDCFVRMAPLDYSLVTQALEAGAGGVMAAQIHSAEQAEQFVRWAKFAPRGTRGMNSGGRDCDFTHKPLAMFAEDANRQHLVAIQIETLGALKQIEQIAAIDGVDLLFLGPADLSQAMGHVGQMDHAEIWDAFARLSVACKAHGKHWGTVPVDPAYADRCVELGCQMLILGGDVLCLRRGLEAIQTAFTSAFQRGAGGAAG